MTRWTDFIKDWAKKNNTTYGCAMSEPKMKEEYYKKYPKQTKEQKKEQKKEDEEKQRLSIFRGSIKNFRDKFVKPYLENKDPILKNDMINKYRKFSQRLKDYIRDNAPKIHEIVNKPAEEKDERQRKKGLMKPKKEEPKKEEQKKKQVDKKPKEPKKITYEYLENNKKRQTDYVLKVGRMMRKYNFLPVEEKRTLLNKKLKKEIEEHMKFIFNAPKSMKEYLSEQFEDKQEFEGQFEKDYDDFINPHWTQDPDGTRPKKKEPKKKEPKKEEKPSKKKPESKKGLTAIVRKVQKGDPRFVENFQKLGRREQLEAMLKQIDITGEPLKEDEYKDIAKDFYKEIFNILSQSASRAIPNIINRFSLPLSDLKALYQGQEKGTKIDFYPTPNKCVDELIESLPRGLRQGVRILEGTAGIGNIAFRLHELYKNKNSSITANELNPKLYNMMTKFLPSDIITTNKDFFNIGKNPKYDIIFINPPYGSVSQGTAFFWLKFVLHGLKILTEMKTQGFLLSITPAMIKYKEGQGKGDQFTIRDIFRGIPGTAAEGTVPITTGIKIINELNETSYTSKEFKKVLVNFDDPDKLNNDELELREIIEEYDILYGEKIGTCEGFGGTGTKADMYIMQVYG